MQRLEALKHVTATGKEYWLAREIYSALGYTWEGFDGVITRAMDACSGVGITPENHFRHTSTMVVLGSSAKRNVVNYFLSRAACYLIAINGDPSKPEVAAAQAYFAVQTRRMEIRDQQELVLTEDQRRLELRSRVKTSFRRVSAAAKEAGVRNQCNPSSTTRVIEGFTVRRCTLCDGRKAFLRGRMYLIVPAHWSFQRMIFR